MVLLWRYVRRLFGIWISWLFTALDMLGLVTIVIEVLSPGRSLPWWLYLSFLLVVTVVGLIAANARLFVEMENRNRELQGYIEELEEAGADIRFKVEGPCCYVPHQPSLCFDLDYDEERLLHPRAKLRSNGLPIGVVIGARLRGEKKSSEAGVLVWKITQTDLPPVFVIGEDNSGAFRLSQLEAPIHRIDDWKDDFTAFYELPLTLAWEGTPRAFAEQLKLLTHYRIVVDYHTERGIESVSKTHSLILEDDFRWLQDQMCERWEEPDFRELAQIAQCP